ncbi:MAG: class I SAM-dependent methyltransferase, partial [Candidatus Marinimicrobia bacterium]|nr:class I SAM-dependent methyltransferase [Candidatus Neomarinimicrobiota bacterium]
MSIIGERYYSFHNEQYWYAGHFVEEFLNIQDHNSLRIFEIGAAEGGLIKYFSEKGHYCHGIEYSKSRYEFSKELNKDSNIKFIHGDITNKSTYADHLREQMNIVICRDVIEHIHPNKKIIALKNMAAVLNPGGKLFISFPPKYSPYAGHQQVAPKKLVKLPYLHLLPDRLYRWYLSMMRMRVSSGQGLLNTKHKRLSIR